MRENPVLDQAMEEETTQVKDMTLMEEKQYLEKQKLYLESDQ